MMGDKLLPKCATDKYQKLVMINEIISYVKYGNSREQTYLLPLTHSQSLTTGH